MSILPGWAVATGMAWTAYLHDRTQWESVPFAVGSICAVLLLNAGKALTDERKWPANAGRVPWFSGVAEMLHMNRSYLEALARAIGAPPVAVLILAWTPWIGLFGFWIFLVAHAVVDFA